MPSAHTFRPLLLMLAAAALLAGAATQARAAAYIKIGDIKGEVTAEGHEDWIEISSFQWGVTLPISSSTAGGATSGKPSFSDLIITKAYDLSSPHLMHGCASGRHIPEVILELKTITGDMSYTYLKITLEDVIISSVSMSSGGDRPQESLSLNFGKATQTYFKQDDKGMVAPAASMSWNIATNTSAATGPEVLRYE